MTKCIEVLTFIHRAIHLRPDLEAVRNSPTIREIDNKIDVLIRK